MKEAKVLLIIPAYNEEENILKTYAAIENYNKKNKSKYDVIVINDGSTDKTVEIIKEYQKSNKNIELHEGKNLGFVKSFFELLKLADADYYSYADQDDIWLENKIELAVNCLNNLDDTKQIDIDGLT